MPRLTEAEKLARKSGLGSSDIPALVGVSPYAGDGPMRVYTDKLGMLADEDRPEFELGHLLEPVLLQHYAHTMGVEVTGREMLIHPSAPWARASLDGWVKGHRIIVEAKAVSTFMLHHWDKLADDGVADYVRIQCAWQMFVADAPQVNVVAMLGGPSGFKIFQVTRDAELEKMLFDRAASFWADLRAGKEPELDDTPATRAYLSAKYPAKPEDVVHVCEAGDEIDELGIARALHANEEKESKRDKDVRNAALMRIMGEKGATKLDAPTWSMTWRGGEGSPRFTVKKVK